MPPSLDVTRKFVQAEVNRLDEVLLEMNLFPVRVQYLVSEILLIRAASILEAALAEIAYKISSGAIYLDGTQPVLLKSCTSVAAARTEMLVFGRTKQLQNLKWTRTKFITQSVEKVINSRDHYVASCTAYGSTIAEIFKVRNFAAHRSKSAKADYQEVVRVIYGRNRNLQLGQFLLSRNLVVVPNLKRYLIEVQSLVDHLVKAPSP